MTITNGKDAFVPRENQWPEGFSVAVDPGRRILVRGSSLGAISRVAVPQSRVQVIKFMTRLAITGLLALVIAAVFHLGHQGVVFIVLYGMTMVQSTLGATIGIAKPLVLWGLLGVAVGLVVSVLATHFSPEYPWITWALFVGLVIFCSLVWPISPTSRMAPVTALVLLLTGTTTGEPVAQALLRALYVVIGMAIALLVSYFVFPQKAGRLAQKMAHDVVQDLRGTAEKLKEALLDPASEWSEEPFLDDLIAIRDRVEKYTSLLVNVKKEGSLIDDSALRQVAIGQRRMIAYQIHLAAAIAGVRGSPLVQAVKDDLISLFRMVDDLLAEWMEGQVPPPEANLRPAGLLLETHLKEFREAHPEVSFDELAAFFGLYHSLLQYAKLTQMVTGDSSLAEPVKA